MVISSVFNKHRHHKATAAPSPAASSNLESTMLEEDVNAAEPVVLRWAVDGSNYARTTSIFHESRDEAGRFFRAVAALQRAMGFFIGSRDRHAMEVMARAHRLIQIAMPRLQKEFYQLLAVNRYRLDAESLHRSSISTSTSCSSLEDLCSLDDEVQPSDQVLPSTEEQSSSLTTSRFSSPAASLTPSDQQPLHFIADLRSIAESMMSAGYAKECFKAYEAVSRSNIDETLFRLGFPRVTPPQPHRFSTTSEAAAQLKSWPHAARSAVRHLFAAEKLLCEGVFSETVKESVFAEITCEAATHLFAFLETAAKATRKSPEKTFELLDAYDALVELLPEVDIIFSHKSLTAVTTQVVTSLNTVAEAVRSTLAEFESAIQSYTSKAPVPGGAVHPLTRYVMNYLAFLADYCPALEEIFAKFPLPPQKPLPDYFFFPPSSVTPPTSAPSTPSRSLLDWDYNMDQNDEDYDSGAAPGNVAQRVAWLVLVLLCRLDGNAGLYRDNVPLAYLFLANNLNYVASKVRSSRLRRLLGTEWVAKHEEKARYYAQTYQKLAWSEVTESIRADPHALVAGEHRDSGIAAAAEMMQRFNVAFESAYRRQAGWVVPDRQMRDELKKSIARKVMMPYAEFYGACRPAIVRVGLGVAVRFAPEDVGNYLSDLFYGDVGGSVRTTSGSGNTSPCRSGSGYSKGSSWWRSR